MKKILDICQNLENIFKILKNHFKWFEKNKLFFSNLKKNWKISVSKDNDLLIRVSLEHMISNFPTL